ncbi:MAG: hypothetical protein Q8M72_02630 [Methylocystis sp.]|nr:hypothetical protein [Methylocystis sp.]
MLANGRKKNCAKACCGTAALAASANANGKTAFPLNDRIVSSLFSPLGRADALTTLRRALDRQAPKAQAIACHFSANLALS